MPDAIIKLVDPENLSHHLRQRRRMHALQIFALSTIIFASLGHSFDHDGIQAETTLHPLPSTYSISLLAPDGQRAPHTVERLNSEQACKNRPATLQPQVRFLRTAIPEKNHG